MVFVCVVSDEHGIVYSCSLARMTDTLTSASPSAVALKRGPVDILCVMFCPQIFSNKKCFPEEHNCGFYRIYIVRQQIRTRLHVRINLYLV